jgi:hypothetical protein
VCPGNTEAQALHLGLVDWGLPMTTPEIAVWFLVAICIWQGWYVARAWRVWRESRGDRIVTCPETGLSARVRIDAAHAATTALCSGKGAIRVQRCSRWPGRGRCDQSCLPEARRPDSASILIAMQKMAGHKL